MNANQNEYQKEINLVEFLFYCLRKWRGIVALMLLMAICVGGYKYRAVVEDNQAKIATQKLQENGDDTGEEKIIMNPRVEAYQFAIEKNEEDLEKRKDFIENSSIMQLDANHVQIGTLSFYIDYRGETENKLDVLMSSYRSFVNDGQMVLRLVEENDKISQEELQCLISFLNVSDIGFVKGVSTNALQSTEQSVLAEIQMIVSGQSVFQIQILAPDEELCQFYIETTQNAILEYSRILQRDVAEHELQLIDSVQSEQISSVLQSYQRQVLEEYVNVLKDQITFRSDLGKLREEEGDYISFETPIVLGNPVNSGVKYAVVGMIAGAFLAVFVLFLIYAMSGRVQNIEFFEEDYGMKLLGRVEPSVGEKKWFGFLDKWIYQMQEGAYVNIPFEEQVKIASANVKAAIYKNEDLKKVMIAGTIGRNDVEDVCVSLTEGIRDITFSTYKQIILSAIDLEEVNDYDAILFVERKGVSVSKLIRQEKKLAEERKVTILGAVLL